MTAVGHAHDIEDVIIPARMIIPTTLTGPEGLDTLEVLVVLVVPVVPAVPEVTEDPEGQMTLDQTETRATEDCDVAMIIPATILTNTIRELK